MKRDVLEINKNMIPYRFEIVLAGEMFEIGVRYNEYADMFTVSLTKNKELICSGEPVVYGVALFQDIYVGSKYPALRIIPYDESDENKEVTWDNFGETVRLVIDNGADTIE